MNFLWAVLELFLSLVVPEPGAAVEVRLVSGQTVRGRWLAANDAGGFVVAPSEGKSQTIDIGSIVAVRSFASRGTPSEVAAGSLRFELAGGDSIVGEIIESTFDDVRVRTRAFGDAVRLPLDRVDRVLRVDGIADIPATLGKDLPSDRDILFVRTRDGIDHVVGEVGKIDANGVVFTWGEKQESTFGFEKDRVIAIRLSGAEAPELEKTGVARVRFRDSSTLTGKLRRAPDQSATLDIGNGLVCTLRDEEIDDITFLGGKAVFLSDLEPTAVRETPIIDGAPLYGVARDRNLLGRELKVGDVGFAKGLAVHSRCEVEYRLDGKMKWFGAAVGIDASVAGMPMRGSVACSILLDGKIVFGPKVVRAGEAPVWIDRIDLSGKKSLVLLADFADNLHFNGRLIWGLPWLAPAE